MAGSGLKRRGTAQVGKGRALCPLSTFHSIGPPWSSASQPANAVDGAQSYGNPSARGAYQGRGAASDKDEVIRRRDLLYREYHHRVLNNLQVIAALLSLQGRQEAYADAASHLAVGSQPRPGGCAPPPTSPFHRRFPDRRIQAISRRTLSRSCNDVAVGRVPGQAHRCRSDRSEAATTTGLPLASS